MSENDDRNPFNVAAAVRHPISLAAMAVIAVSLVIRVILEMDIFPRLSGDQAFVLINRALIYIFILAVIVLLAVIVITYLGKHDTDQETAEAGQEQAADTLPAAPAPTAPQTPDDSRPPSPGSVDTGGGAYIGGDVQTGGGDFVGRDQVNARKPDQE